MKQRNLAGAQASSRMMAERRAAVVEALKKRDLCMPEIMDETGLGRHAITRELREKAHICKWVRRYNKLVAVWRLGKAEHAPMVESEGEATIAKGLLNGRQIHDFWIFALRDRGQLRMA